LAPGQVSGWFGDTGGGVTRPSCCRNLRRHQVSGRRPFDGPMNKGDGEAWGC
jgi:hypothetical protein